MKMRNVTLIVGLLIGLVLYAYAGPSGGKGKECRGGGPGPHGGGPGHIIKLLSELDLSDAQIEDIASIMKSAKEEKKENMKKGREIHKQMMDLALADEYDEEAVSSLAEEAAAFHTEKITEMTKTLNKIGQVLTTEQKSALKTKMAENEDRRKNEREKMEKFRRIFQNK